jgi:DNA-directed RNA polymerase specialized sigma24 family protein
MYLLQVEDAPGDLAAALPSLRPRLWTFALRLAGNRQDALDLVRRACEHAFERPEQFPTGFATPSAMFSLVHFIWFHQRAAAGSALAAGSAAAAGSRQLGVSW